MLASGFLNFAVLWTHAVNAPDWKPLLTGALAPASPGRLVHQHRPLLSTVTKNQIIAGSLTFGLLLGIWILGWLDSRSFPTWVWCGTART